MSSLVASANVHPLLEQQLDWDHEGVDKDLIHMLNWEEKLCSHLGLTEVDRHDIYPGKPELQRCGDIDHEVECGNYCIILHQLLCWYRQEALKQLMGISLNSF